MMRGLTTAIGYNTLYFCYGGAVALVRIPLVIDIRKTKTVNIYIDRRHRPIPVLSVPLNLRLNRLNARAI